MGAKAGPLGLSPNSRGALSQHEVREIPCLFDYRVFFGKKEVNLLGFVNAQ
jgi:hypothetical protein